MTKGFKDYLAEANAQVETCSVQDALRLHGRDGWVFVDVRDAVAAGLTFAAPVLVLLVLISLLIGLLALADQTGDGRWRLNVAYQGRLDRDALLPTLPR